MPLFNLHVYAARERSITRERERDRGVITPSTKGQHSDATIIKGMGDEAECREIYTGKSGCVCAMAQEIDMQLWGGVYIYAVIYMRAEFACRLFLIDT